MVLRTLPTTSKLQGTRAVSEQSSTRIQDGQRGDERVPIHGFSAQAFILLALNSKEGLALFVYGLETRARVAGCGQAGLHGVKNLCVWTKGCGGMGSLYRSAHELVFVLRMARIA